MVTNWSLVTDFNPGKNVWVIKVNGVCKRRVRNNRGLVIVYQICVEMHSERDQRLTLQSELDGEALLISRDIHVVRGHNILSNSYELKHGSVEEWWPRGYGEARLYRLRARILSDEATEVASHTFSCGFRTCQLVQDALENNQKGDSFHFRVNGVDVFAKGSNWIPGHVFDRLMTTEKKWTLLESCVAANMNMVRIWGGGRYETDGTKSAH